MRADILDRQGAKHSLQWAEYRCARPIISRSPHPACTARPVHTKYMIRRRRPPSQSWRKFLRNHAEAIAAIDLCLVPTVHFECLFAFVVIGHGRRQLLWFAVTRHPTAEWLAQQILEAFPWETAPTYLVRDNDGAYSPAYRRRVRAMGIRDRPISPRSPWQNPYAERLIRNAAARLPGSTVARSETGDPK
jgi:transposase InsO family protein